MSQGPGIDWDTYFMSLAYLVGMKSKDPRTRVGAVVVGPVERISLSGPTTTAPGRTTRFARPATTPSRAA